MVNYLKKFIIICGHYGCGKTNLTLNLALDYSAGGHKVTVVDMDLVNPYFRTSDFRGILEEKGVEVIAPVYAATNLDIPALPAAMYSIFEGKDIVIIDVGGDDVGATVLGRFRKLIQNIDYDMLYVVNRYRIETTIPSEAVQILKEIEAVTGLKATCIVNNSHLMSETDASRLIRGAEFAKQVSFETKLPILCQTVRKDIYDNDSEVVSAMKNINKEAEIYPIDIKVKNSLDED